MANGEAVKRQTVAQFPAILPSVIGDQPDDSPSWIKRRFYDLGVLNMANEPVRPPGFYLNYSTALFYLAVIASILGGFWFMHDRIDRGGYERGVLDTEKKAQAETIKALTTDIQNAQASADEAKKLGIYAARDADDASGHTKEPKK